MQIIIVIVFLLAAFVSAFSSRTGAKIEVGTAKFYSGGCGCISLFAVITLGVLFYLNRIPPFPSAGPLFLMLIPAAMVITIGTLAGLLFTDPTMGKGGHDFSVSLITATFF
jgi:hypothetical protein